MEQVLIYAFSILAGVFASLPVLQALRAARD